MRRSVFPQRRVKFQSAGGVDEEQHLTVVSRTEKVATTGDDSPLFSAERIRTIDTVGSGPEGPRFPNLHAMFAHKAMHQEDLQQPEAPKATEEIKAVVVRETTSKASSDGGVDKEAEDFIRRRRHSLELQKLMSIKAA